MQNKILLTLSLIASLGISADAQAKSTTPVENRDRHFSAEGSTDEPYNAEATKAFLNKMSAAAENSPPPVQVGQTKDNNIHIVKMEFASSNTINGRAVLLAMEDSADDELFDSLKNKGNETVKLENINAASCNTTCPLKNKKIESSPVMADATLLYLTDAIASFDLH